MAIYNNLEIIMESNDQAAKALELIKEIASKRASEEMTEFLTDLSINGSSIVMEDNCSLDPDDYMALTIDIAKACAPLTQTSFEVCVDSWSDQCGFSALMHTVRNGNEVEIFSAESENGDGTCPDCGMPIVSYAEYDPNAVYCCPECGEELDHYDLFEGCLPKIHREIVLLSK